MSVEQLSQIANKLRIWSIKATCASSSGHPTSCCSMAEIMSTLFFKVMKYDPKNPKHPCNDRFVLSKGHAAPILYAAWAEAGLFSHSELLKLRQFGHELEGHPTPKSSFVDVATGSLGQGISFACGMAYAGQHVDKAKYRTYVVIGDGESAEGSVWEAISFAGTKKLSNIVFIFDINRLGQSDPTSLQHSMIDYSKRIESFGVHTIVVDGHDVSQLVAAFEEASCCGKPVAILAKTFKGKGIMGIEDQMNWHGKPIPKDVAEKTIKDLEGKCDINGDYTSLIPKPQCPKCPTLPNLNDLKLVCDFKKGEMLSTRQVYGNALVQLREKATNLMAFDADTKNSTFSITLKEKYPENFCECFIAEQNMVGVGVGAACRSRCISFVSTFAVFFTRCFDHIRMAAISRTNANFVGSHCGISIGEDGPSQMGLEDIAMFRTIPNCVVFYPSDAVSMYGSMSLAAKKDSMCFIRTSRPQFPVIYPADKEFFIGKANIINCCDVKDSRCLLIGAGITLHESLKACKLLKQEGIDVYVMDLFTIEPLDKNTIKEYANKSGGNIIVTEDHYYQGGIGEAVSGAFASDKNIAVYQLAVSGIPMSGKCDQLMQHFKIDSQSIMSKVKEVV